MELAVFTTLIPHFMELAEPYIEIISWKNTTFVPIAYKTV